MRYQVDETTKTITIEGNPSLFVFVEMMNKRFPNDEWKKYELKFKSLSGCFPSEDRLKVKMKKPSFGDSIELKKQLDKIAREVIASDMLLDIFFSPSAGELHKACGIADKNSHVRDSQPPSNTSIA